MSILSDALNRAGRYVAGKERWTPKDLMGGERGDMWRLGGRDVEQWGRDFNESIGGGKWQERMHAGIKDWSGPHAWNKSLGGGAWYRDRFGGSKFDEAFGGGRWQDRFGINLFPDDDDDSEDEETSAIETITTPTVKETLELATGLGEGSEDAPMFTDVSMVASRSKARRNLGALGYDTGTSKGRAIDERKNRRMGTALTSFTATA